MVIVRREVLLKTGGFKDQMPALQDYELWIRLARLGYKFFYIDQVLTKLSETFGLNQNNQTNQANQVNPATNPANNQNKPQTPVTSNKPTTPVTNNQKIDAKNPVVAELVNAKDPNSVLTALQKLGVITTK
jgi:hypothetical protein